MTKSGALSGRGAGAPKAELLYLYPQVSSFIQRDLDALSARYDVHHHQLLRGHKWLVPWRILAQFFWLVRNRVWKLQVICHFSGFHALLPALLAKRSFIILAGSDCARIPGIGYGDHTRVLKGWATRTAARLATRLLPVHHSLILRGSTYDPIVPTEQGLLAFTPGLKTPWTEVPYGFDASYWTPGETRDRDPRCFISVPGAAAPTNRLHRLKGVDMVLLLAPRLPSARFIILGLADTSAYPSAPPNVTFVGRIGADELRKYYRSASFHLQLSLSEGMPNALCEAMLCGCIPLVSDVSSMPDIVEGCGMVLKRADLDLGAEACSALLALDAGQRTERSHAARERVRLRYPMRRRLETLSQLLEEEN